MFFLVQRLNPGIRWPPRDWVPSPMRFSVLALAFATFSTNLRLQSRPPYKSSRQTIPIPTTALPEPEPEPERINKEKGKAAIREEGRRRREQKKSGISKRDQSLRGREKRRAWRARSRGLI